MSTTFSPHPHPHPHPQAPIWRRARFSRWLREPLLHFVILGAILFAVDHFIGSRTDDPHTIVVDGTVDNQARQLFKASRGHEPNDEELFALRHVWLDNEVLYREGLALQVDKGDDAIRERVIFKSLSVIDAGVKLPQYDDKLLQEWFEKHREKYDEPARFDFQEAVLAGEATESAIRAFVSSLNAGTPGDLKAGLRIFKARPRVNLVQSYGEDFAVALEKSASGDWQALPTKDGWRAVRLEAQTPPKPAVYATLRGVVLQDWTDSTMAQQRSEAVRALARKYTVTIDGPGK